MRSAAHYPPSKSAVQEGRWTQVTPVHPGWYHEDSGQNETITPLTLFFLGEQTNFFKSSYQGTRRKIWGGGVNESSELKEQKAVGGGGGQAVGTCL